MDCKAKMKYWPGLVSLPLLLFFLISYILTLEKISSRIPEAITSLILFIGVALIVFLTIVKNRNMLYLIKNLQPLYIYLCFLLSALLLSSFFAEDLLYSSIRLFFSISTLGVTFTVFYIIQYIYIKDIKWQKFLEVSFLIFLIFIIIGQLIIPDWTAGKGGIRLSGGTNPNTIAFFVLYILLQTHFNALITGRWTRLQKLIWVISFIVIVWTLSRTVILMLFIIYTLTLINLFVRKVKLQLKYGISVKKMVKVYFGIIVSAFFCILISVNIFKSDGYSLIKERVFNTENVSSRSDAWNILLSFFSDNPFFGGVGWWGGSKVLVTNQLESIASSPHNLYVRLLSEVGVIGMVMVLILPTILCWLLFTNKIKIEAYFKAPLGKFLAIVLIANYLGQFFEDRYLVGVFGIGNNIIIWFMSLSLLIYHVGIGRYNNHER